MISLRLCMGMTLSRMRLAAALASERLRNERERNPERRICDARLHCRGRASEAPLPNIGQYASSRMPPSDAARDARLGLLSIGPLS